tara:strand:- start:61223 stop:61819 length:597 start_codon:yes stop_codon:yes gene_type:complete
LEELFKSMKKIMAVTAVLVIMFAITMNKETRAQDTALKLAVVNMQTILNKSEAGVAAVKMLKALAEKETKALQEKQKALKKLETEFEKQRIVSKPAVLEKKEREIIRARRELELSKEDTRRNVQRTQARETQRVVNEVRKLLAEYAKINGYTMVLEKNDNASPIGSAVLFADPTLDITADIVQLYNKQYRQGSLGPRR